MTEEAQNALLKTLEETPADSLLILISRSTSGLLDTIISRCNILKFRKKSHLEDTLTRSGIIDKFLSYREKQIENLLENKNREEVQFIVKTLLGVYRDILFLKLDAEDSILLNPEKKEVFVNLLQSYTLKQLHPAIEILADTAEKIDCNINLKNCVMNILIALKQIKGQEVI
jgi:DNA polymerase-3 subunit delta'